MNNEAFVYCWTDHLTKKLYVGSHKGTVDDGYTSSSKLLEQELRARPADFTRQIIAEGKFMDMRKLESVILQTVDAKNDPTFYNGHNNAPGFVCKGHTEKTKQKLRDRIFSAEHRRKMSENNVGFRGRQHSFKSKQKISQTLTGYKHDVDFCQKQREAKLGNKNPNKNGNARRGAIITTEQRVKLSDKLKGHNPGFWWTNGKQCIRSNEQPGNDFVRGRKICP